MPQLEFNFSTSPKSEYSLHALGEFLSLKKRRVIIALDEFQQIVHYNDASAEATFRAWAQQFPSLRFIFSGSHRHMMTSMFSESNRPFYRSAQLFSLEAIPESEYYEFITGHFDQAEKKIALEHIKTVLEWAKNQTYYIQLTCNKLYGKNDEVRNEDLQKVFDEMIQQEIPIFSSYQQLLTTFQWKLIKAIAKEDGVENPMSQSFLKAYALGAASSVKSALQILIRKELVIIWEGRYQLHDTLLLRWLQKL